MIKNIRVKFLVIGVLSTLFLFNSCSNKNTVSIKGIVTSSKDTKIYLDKLNFSKSIIIDSVNISEGKDDFRFKVSSVVEPTFFILRVPGKGSITLLAEPNEKIQFIFDCNRISDYTVVGSKGSSLARELTKTLSTTTTILDSLRIKYGLASDPSLKTKIEQEYSAAIESQRDFSTKFVWANVMSRASVMALYQKIDGNTYVFDREEDVKLFKAVATSLKAFYPNSDYTKGMLDDIKRMDAIVRTAKINSLISQTKSSLPEIALPNIQGDTVKLSSFKGKVVLLDFWASWDQASMMDNRELIEIYRQYKGKGFEIFQVSLDVNRDEWVNAIESAGIPWTNVSELNPKGSYIARLYNITQMPANYLIDRNHLIVGKNLFGEELKKKLRELL